MQLGSLLNKKGILDQQNDIFYLSYDEIKGLIKDNSSKVYLTKKIIERKSNIERYKDITLPEVIYNELPESALIKGKILCNLKGVATCRGHYIGPARIVHGPSDFKKIKIAKKIMGMIDEAIAGEEKDEEMREMRKEKIKELEARNPEKKETRKKKQISSFS